MSVTFGNTVRGSESADLSGYIMMSKYQSGPAGPLASITLRMDTTSGNKVKCAIYDSSFNLLANGTTEERSQTEGWMTFIFPSSPQVAASTDYYLAFWWQGTATIYRNPDTPDISRYKELAYGDWPDPLTDTTASSSEYPLYATYKSGETFGQTEILISTLLAAPNVHWAIKFTSGSAGPLASITLHAKYEDYPASIKCAIFDSDLNKVANGETEEKVIESGQDDWVTFNFGASKPVVAARTIYWLAFWFNQNITVRKEPGTTDQLIMDAKTYNSWRDPLEPDNYFDEEHSVYATYYEALPPPKKLTLVQMVNI